YADDGADAVAGGVIGGDFGGGLDAIWAGGQRDGDRDDLRGGEHGQVCGGRAGTAGGGAGDRGVWLVSAAGAKRDGFESAADLWGLSIREGAVGGGAADVRDDMEICGAGVRVWGVLRWGGVEFWGGDV